MPPTQIDNEKVSKLVRDLMTLPGIVANLGISIAEGQKQLNLSYLRTVLAFIQIARETLGKDLTADVLARLLKDVAPPRYQFTETRLDFRADLFEASQWMVSGGLSGGFGGVAVNVAGAAAGRSDYRAAARISTTLHAISPSDETLGKLLEQVRAAPETTKLPAGASAIDKALLDELKNVRAAIGT